MSSTTLLGGTSAYSLTTADMERSVRQLVGRHEKQIGQARDRGLRTVVVSIDGSDPLSDVGRTIEQAVFDADYGGHRNSPELMSKEFGPYEDRSVFFVAIDLDKEVAVGTLRGVVSWAGIGPMCKTMRDCLSIEHYGREFSDVIDLRDEVPNPLAHIGLLGQLSTTSPGISRQFLEQFHAMEIGDLIFDMATVVVPKEHRSPIDIQQIGELLYAASYRAAVKIEAQHGVTFIHEGLLGHFRSTLGMPWEDLGGLGSTQYIESDPFLSQPAYLSLNRFARTISREQYRQVLNRPQKYGERHEPFINLLASPTMEDQFLL
ncbi:MAG: hypothetical protein HKN94_03930 [Acidimicrobiales bacterium]|nr:hypothetical protein [Acidimicrobiia bacterium]NNC79283.1 hypothetical protein [Acidimicrobiales bacterium]RZV47838.1 MAG: hypothetical protein EX269_03920 [Acidimicrobiales bacterium]